VTDFDNDPSIENEPHLGGDFEVDPSESAASRQLSKSSSKETNNDRVEHTVWDEPGLAPATAADRPVDALTFSSWLTARIAETSYGYSWLATFGIALAAGPWALLGTFTGGGQSFAGLLMVTVFGPVLEEMMKIAAALWVVEKRPFLFRSPAQIVVCVLVSGLVFAAIENVLYIEVYTEDPSELLIQWRWSVCVALHMGCSLVAGLGLMRIWGRTMKRRTRPRLALGAGYMVAAMVIHGAYNSFAVLLSYMEYRI
jgi:hypothetical protein